MVKLSSVLAGVAAAGLMIASPVVAQTRSSDSLPASSVSLTSSNLARTASPVADANELNGRRTPILLLLLLLGSVGAAVLIASGGGGGNDSPG